MDEELFERLVTCCRTLYSQGAKQEDVYLELERLRGVYVFWEEVEDTILEVMDLVYGWCSEENRIWKTVLTL